MSDTTRQLLEIIGTILSAMVPIIIPWLIIILQRRTGVEVSKEQSAWLEGAAQRAITWGINRATENGAHPSQSNWQSLVLDLAKQYLEITSPDRMSKLKASDAALTTGLQARMETPTVVAPSGSTTVPVAPTVTGAGLPSDPFLGSNR